MSTTRATTRDRVSIPSISAALGVADGEVDVGQAGATRIPEESVDELREPELRARCLKTTLPPLAAAAAAAALEALPAAVDRLPLLTEADSTADMAAFRGNWTDKRTMEEAESRIERRWTN